MRELIAAAAAAVRAVYPYRKAIAGGILAGLAAYAVAADGGVTAVECAKIAAAVVTGSGLVYAVPNRPAE